jgi:DNA polymerase V
MTDKRRSYIAIDLKSFYASVECVERGLNPLNTNLVVADASRTDKTICLAVTPSLKSYGISGRARLFEVVQRINEVNYERKSKLRNRRFSGKSHLDNVIKEHPDVAVDYITATPRMGFYIEYSTRIYNIYLKYIASEDIHVYSIDEVFIDATNYLQTYKTTAHELARKIIQDILNQTGITATAGIGTNMYLCKIAMDIVAKHIPADSDGVRIAELDEMSYRKELWNHKPLTDFWRIGHGTAERLALYDITTMGQIARCSINNKPLLYKLFGINAELLIDHAWGWEPCTIDYVKAYRPETHSMSSGQVLHCAYSADKAKVVTCEMADEIALSLVENGLATKQLILMIGYDRESLSDKNNDNNYDGAVYTDHYGRKVPKHARGTINLKKFTSSSRIIMEAVARTYDKIVNPKLLVRRINITTVNIVPLSKVKEPEYIQLDLFTDYEKYNQNKTAEEEQLNKEKRMQEALISIKNRYGKNAILKGLNFKEGATAIERNNQIGGHKA